MLGLGTIGPLASKPVMEGKAVLFKKFAGIDVFDIEIDERDPDKLVEIICALEPTFGGINLEDIKAPECFYVETQVPRAHEDSGIPRRPARHGDHRRRRGAQRPCASSARTCAQGQARRARARARRRSPASTCWWSSGVQRENIWVSDIAGVVYAGRKEEMDDNKARYAQDTDARKLADIIAGADIFIGLSAARVLKPEMLKQMADRPLILALANPEPEIMPDVAKAARPDAIIATGRSDFPNQVNNVLCFPFIFRGALDVGATTINEAMKLACVRAIADLAMVEQSDIVAAGVRRARMSSSAPTT